MNIKDRVSTFISDPLRFIIAVTNAILALSMIWSPEPHNHFFWFTLVFRITTIPVAVFIGNKGLWVLYFIFCNVKALDITYDNYTCVALITVLFCLTPKVSKKHAIFMASFYITDVFIVAGMHNKSAFYIYTHFMLCIQFCTAMWKQKVVNKKESTKIIILTPKEIEILEQLKDGSPKKNVEGYSEPTVYRKLTEARDRNNLSDNKELINIYSNNNL